MLVDKRGHLPSQCTRRPIDNVHPTCGNGRVEGVSISNRSRVCLVLCQLGIRKQNVIVAARNDAKRVQEFVAFQSRSNQDLVTGQRMHHESSVGVEQRQHAVFCQCCLGVVADILRPDIALGPDVAKVQSITITVRIPSQHEPLHCRPPICFGRERALPQ